MSFILDALKKSDMQARQAELPSIHSSHAASNRQQHRPGWQYALFGGAVAGLVLAATFLLLPGKTNDQLQSSAVTQPEPVAAPVLPATAENTTAPALHNPASNAVSEPTPATAPVVADSAPLTASSEILPSEIPAQASPKANIQPAGLQGNQQPAPSTPQAEAPAALALPDFAPQKKAPPPLKNKLPLNVQQAIPSIEISGHIFDERPAARMVFINGHIQREGDTISPGLRLVAITPSGVEMSFRDTPFRIDLFANRVRSGN
ncbi:MAG: hypothetical protein COW19_04945 [Zetaproteobacteria bacterium CG12_big_fil_rev_8_21_14_0_65_55_1124]|nr:MAG: hypothetical protein AUJ58_01015 [Zetaproteobacteria bacterium CG1_02_55_237]PIS18493.1 MAG: hypothetical protein COT53_10445 [Zetaproteobacteria bacterium CG08_land_8_20_14_0_20_55_17]PIW43027.1 MAG: hypothetical protein COW19_04945 [Zetaproteobacteria bacterium CG12_big_fil_rev_8_21_14_0_65_55_1124]PIY52606.1 MAG: hypothetical protein COZ01_07160 [Zetaproteobacteria bacterium CG_4_10_14_0_8_um_filter_55_43]PIZ36833.1 MAG: hypothetical protein COY36_11005 [Zetaproteobacteria bacterium 